MVVVVVVVVVVVCGHNQCIQLYQNSTHLVGIIRGGVAGIEGGVVSPLYFEIVIAKGVLSRDVVRCHSGAVKVQLEDI